MPAVERIDDIGTLIDLFGGVARGQLSDCVKSLDARTGEGARSEDAWNDTSVELTQAAMAHTRYYVVKVVGFQTFTLRRLFGKKDVFLFNGEHTQICPLSEVSQNLQKQQLDPKVVCEPTI